MSSSAVSVAIPFSPAPEPTPNAALIPGNLRPSVILCCGEDKQAFLAALALAGLPVPAIPNSEFRSYSVWTLPEVTIILASIGTGSLEPLLFELLSLNLAKRIVLVGTAGSLGPKRLPLGNAYPIAEAWLSGTGLDREVPDQPLRPHWPALPPGPTAALVSSDFYYGFSPSQSPGDYRQRLPALSRDFARISAHTDLVDMEVAQFYALCRLIPEQPGLHYLAIKGASNSVDNHSEQNTHAPSVLLHCLQKALVALGLAPAVPAP